MFNNIFRLFLCLTFIMISSCLTLTNKKHMKKISHNCQYALKVTENSEFEESIDKLIRKSVKNIPPDYSELHKYITETGLNVGLFRLYKCEKSGDSSYLRVELNFPSRKISWYDVIFPIDNGNLNYKNAVYLRRME